MNGKEDYIPLINQLKLDLYLAITCQMGVRRVDEFNRRLRVILLNDNFVQEQLRIVFTEPVVMPD